MTRLNEPIACSMCESPTFRIRKEHYKDNDTLEETTDIVVYCSKCGKKYYTVQLSGGVPVI